MESDLGSNPRWITSLHWSLRRPLTSRQHLLPPSGPTSSQGSLTSQPLPSHPLPREATGFSPPHPRGLVQDPRLLPAWLPLSSHFPHDPFPELQPDLMLDKASLPVSLSCPWDKIQTLYLDLCSNLLQGLPSVGSSFLWPPLRGLFPQAFSHPLVSVACPTSP